MALAAGIGIENLLFGVVANLWLLQNKVGAALALVDKTFSLQKGHVASGL